LCAGSIRVQKRFASTALSCAAIHYPLQHHLLLASISYACLYLHISQVTIPPSSFFVIIHGKESYTERESARKSNPVVSNDPQSERGAKMISSRPQILEWVITPDVSNAGVRLVSILVAVSDQRLPNDYCNCSLGFLFYHHPQL
jgi:hypothetical protein